MGGCCQKQYRGPRAIAQGEPFADKPLLVVPGFWPASRAPSARRARKCLVSVRLGEQIEGEGLGGYDEMKGGMGCVVSVPCLPATCGLEITFEASSERGDSANQVSWG